MATTTPRLGLRQPGLTDQDDVPADLAQVTGILDDAAIDAGFGAYAGLPPAGVDGRYYWATDRGQLLRDDGATWQVVGAGSPPLVSALPAGPFDGQEVVLQVFAGGQVNWHLRHRAAAPEGKRWEFIGGPPLIAPGSPSAVTNGVYADIAGAQLGLTVPGMYSIGLTAHITNSGALGTCVVRARDASGSQVGDSIEVNGAGVGATCSGSWTVVTTAPAVITAQRWANTGTWAVNRPVLTITPVAIGG